jgi:hypothetical protein
MRSRRRRGHHRFKGVDQRRFARGDHALRPDLESNVVSELAERNISSAIDMGTKWKRGLEQGLRSSDMPEVIRSCIPRSRFVDAPVA